MMIDSILTELEAMGTAQNRKIYTRHGVTDEMYGVSYANLDKLARRLRKEKETFPLAESLWGSGNHDAKVLATKILHPKDLNQKKANDFVKAVTHSLQGGGLAGVIVNTDFAPKLVDQWVSASPSRSHGKVAMGWTLLAEIAIAKKHHLEQPDSWFIGHLDEIEKNIHESPNEIRYVMNSALISIGSRNQNLRKKANAAAKRIGKVDVDHGETSCKTPDAVIYIEKVWARRK